MAETFPKTPVPKKATAESKKAGIADARAAEKKAEPKKAATRKAAPAAENGKAGKTAAVKKTPAPRKSVAATTAPAGTKRVSDEQRYRMIAEAAYFRAESCQFQGDPLRDWIEAERDIAVLLNENA